MKTIILYALYYLCDGNSFCEQHMKKCVDFQPWEAMNRNEQIYIYDHCRESFLRSEK